MEAKEANQAEIVEDLTVDEETADDVKGGELSGDGAGKIKFNEFMIKKC